MEFRHEWKHEIRYPDLLALRARLRAVMSVDMHTIDGKYEVRSLYFDSPEDKALREKINGVNCREKFRIRCYNGDMSLILLEKKSKRNGLCSKTQEPLTLEEVRTIVYDGEHPVRGKKTLLDELYFKMNTQGIRPKTIVDYTREPFVFGPGNVRVTLDYNIRTGLTCTDFLNPVCVTVPAKDAPVILEVKWDEFLPSVIRDIVQVPGTHTSAFSKYAVCRIYG
ncbi:MAG TPA: polyphosphate polymerase domain-containing protein [Candidatus Caccomorpha excrementavium]|nr:polyphosphate polymerase domain-containing protein [Candidatus Caccomorpha excrementavium]